MKQPTRLGDYEVLDKLGSGGMGEVYRVRNVISDRLEAMKVLLPDLAGRQDLAARFLREIKVLAALDHPNIAALRTALTVDNRLVMIMELVEGQSLAQRLAQGPIPADDALDVVRQVLGALDYAHRQDVIHRDIKPANMMITPQGVVKLMDFGIARSTRDQTITQTGAATGSLNYISPEQINGGTPDARSDLYSLGVSLYEMVTGQLPFTGDNDVAVMFAHLQKAPVPPSAHRPALSPDLEAVVMRAIAKDPAARFQTAAAFRDAVIAAPLTVAGMPVPPAVAATPPVPPLPALPVIAAMSTTPATTDTAPLRGPQQPAAAAPRSPAPLPPPRRVQGGVRPVLYVALGAFLVVAAIGGMAYYARLAEANPPDPATAPRPLVSSPSAPAPQPTTAAPAAATQAGTAPAPEAGAEPAASVAPADAAITPPPAAAASEPISPQPEASQPLSTPTPAVDSAPAAGATAPSARVSPRQPSVRPPSVKRPAGEPAPAIPVERSAAAPVRRDDAQPTAPPAPGAATAPDAAQLDASLDRLEAALDLLSARAAAVNGTLDRLKAEQAAAGYGLRGDMAARQQMLNTNLARAEEALDRRDLARAERFKALVQGDLEALEQFIGR